MELETQDQVVRRRMQSNRSKDTSPEMEIRKRLHALGYRYRIHVRPIPTMPRTADIVFTRARLAIFIDGCFWHHCPTHGSVPKSNVESWLDKFLRNQVRDAETNAALTNAGWTVLRIWEHEDATDAVQNILQSLNGRRARALV